MTLSLLLLGLAQAGPDASSEVVRFIALGDTGTGDDRQKRVAEVIRVVCEERGCDFGLLLGDNLYPLGPEGADDERFISVFVEPYGDLGLPFYVVLGNHDYGTAGLDLMDGHKSHSEIEFGKRHPNWRMPSEYYAFETGPAQFLALDTTQLVNGATSSKQQAAWLKETLQGSSASWRIAFGHHTVRSLGHHGDAGNYEGNIPSWLPGAPIALGTHWKRFFDDHLCDKVDLYLAGHDHNRQWLTPSDENCSGVVFVVSGAGAKTKAFRSPDAHPVEFAEDRRAGFVWIEIRGDELTAAWYDEHGALDATLKHQRNE